MRFAGKTAVITGGAGGIGQAAAEILLAEGANVLLVDLSEAQLAEAEAALKGGERLRTCVADVSQAADTARYVAQAQQHFGGIDIFFNNAAIEGRVAPLTELAEADFDRLMAVNVRGVWLGLKHVMPVMAAGGGGSIVITSSVAGLGGTPGVVAYVTSKHALVGMMKVAALEGAPQNIRVNTLHPGPVDNRMMRSLEEGFAPGAGEAVKAEFEQRIPLKRYASNQDVAHLFAFLASDQAAYLTGNQYVVDGGMRAS